jgi:hypothetical protein
MLSNYICKYVRRNQIPQRKKPANMIRLFMIKCLIALSLTSRAQRIENIKYDSCRIYATEYEKESYSNIGCDMLPYMAKDSFSLDQKSTSILWSKFEAERLKLEPSKIAHACKSRYSIEARALFIFYYHKHEPTVVVFGQPGLISFDDTVCFCPVVFFAEICNYVPGLRKVMRL